MKAKDTLKKAVIGSLTAAMVLGGSASAFAQDGKGKGHDDDSNKGRSEWNKVIDQKNDKNQNGSWNSNGKGNSQIVINFNDIKGEDVEWALRYIASLASSRVFEGYEDGSFQPRKPITRIEAITAAVRLMGLRDKAESQEEMNTKLNFSDADKIASKYPWAVGYVAVALENDLFSEGDAAVQPEKPADRLWATTLLVKALKLEGEANAKMNSQLNFKDAGKIPAGSVGYVAVALEKGLINGYEDKTFRPNQPVTRAELAALLDRTGENIPGREQGTVTGKVTIPVSGNILTIEKDGKTTVVTLDPATFVFRNGTRASISDLQPGDEVKVRLFNNVAVFVEVTKAQNNQNQAFTVNGYFKSLTLNAKGEIDTVSITQSVYDSVYNGPVSTYKVASDLKITGNPSQLVLSQAVQLKGWDQLVHFLEIK